MPGVRLENLVDVDAWSRAVDTDALGVCMSKCATTHQRDMALWTFPLRWEGLPVATWQDLQADGVLTERQRHTFEALQHEGLIVRGEDRFSLSLLGEVFMGHLVRDLKAAPGLAAVDAYIAEGEALGRAAALGVAPDDNALNDRQQAHRWLDRG